MTQTDADTGEIAEDRPEPGSDYTSDLEFVDFPIREDTLKGIVEELGFATATPVQASTIEPALAGKDLVVRAKTGTGKTAAFLIPMIDRAEDGARKPFALVLAPTRELAQQTAQQAQAITAFRDLGVATLVGGVAIGPQEDALAAGAEILVGTPGRILDHMKRGNLDASSIQVICLDEADEMLSMGFYEDVTRILEKTAKDRQILLYSATISPDTQRIVQRYLRDPLEIMLSTDADGVELIDHVVYETTPEMHRVQALLYVIDLENPTSAIVFCNTREDTATVATYLDRQGLDAQLISGELSQARRTAVMNKVKKGEVRFLVATDVASRGIDISDLSHVINYSLPQDPAVYLHRTGRTGRIGKKGTAISLVGGPDLGTKRQLDSVHKIDFTERELPSKEDAVRMRVERQAKQIKAAMGSLVFESYMPTVRALMERPDGPMLLAAALRAFFTWDRERRAEASGLSTVDALIAERRDKRERDDERGGRGGRDRKGRDRKGRDRDDRGGRREGGRGGRSERRRDDDGGRGKKRDDRPKKARDAGADDLDALLEVGDDAPKKPAKAPKKDRAPQAAKPKGGKSIDLDDLDGLLDLD